MTLNALRFRWSGTMATIAMLGVVGAAGCDGDRFIGEGPGSLGGAGSTSTGVGGSGASTTQSTQAGGGIGQSTFGGASGATNSPQSGGGSGGYSVVTAGAGGTNPGLTGAGGTNSSSTHVGGAAGSPPAVDPCRGLEGDWSVTPVVKARAREWGDPLPKVGSELAPIGLRLARKDELRCALEFMPNWSPSWSVDLVGSTDGLGFDVPIDHELPVAIECRDNSTWRVLHLGLTNGGEPKLQWSSRVRAILQDVQGDDDVTLEGVMQRGLPPLQLDGYRTYGKGRDWCTMTDPACYSPTQNVHLAYDAGSVGCPCSVGSDSDVCVAYDDAGRDHLVALVCDSDRWQAVIDGPCWGGAPGSQPIIIPAIAASGMLLPWETFGVHASRPVIDIFGRFTASVAGQSYPVTVLPAEEPMATRKNSVYVSDWGALMGKTLYLSDPSDSTRSFAYGFAQLPILPAYVGEDLAQLVHNAYASLTTVDGSVVLSMNPKSCSEERMYVAGRLATTDKSRVAITIREADGTLPAEPPRLVLRGGTTVELVRKSESPVPDIGKDIVFEASIAGQSEVGFEVTVQGACPPLARPALKSVTAE